MKQSLINITDKISIAHFTEENITREYLSWLSDTEICKYSRNGLYMYNKAAALKWYEELEFDKTIVYAIYYGKAQLHIGNCAIDQIDWIGNSAEIGFLIGNKKFWGKRIATEVGKKLIEICHKRMGLHKVWLGCARGNIGMQHAARNMGMQFECSLKYEMLVDGMYQDVIRYSIFNPSKEIYKND